MSFTYKMDKGGVTEILKSAAVKAELEALADQRCAQANRMLHSHDPNAGSHEYMVHVKDLTHTAVATVHTTGMTTERDQRKHHTLNAVNH